MLVFVQYEGIISCVSSLLYDCHELERRFISSRTELMMICDVMLPQSLRDTTTAIPRQDYLLGVGCKHSFNELFLTLGLYTYVLTGAASHITRSDCE